MASNSKNATAGDKALQEELAVLQARLTGAAAKLPDVWNNIRWIDKVQFCRAWNIMHDIASAKDKVFIGHYMLGEVQFINPINNEFARSYRLEITTEFTVSCGMKPYLWQTIYGG